MKRSVAIALTLYGGISVAGEPVTPAEKLAGFTSAGCAYLKSAWDQPVRESNSDPKIAIHFGRVLKKERRGIVFNYHLQSADFPGWDVSYWNHGLELKPPSNLVLTLGDLEKVFGVAQPPDDEDNAMPATAGAAAHVHSERLKFPTPPRLPLCRIIATVERDETNAGKRRVFLVRFND